MRQMRRGIEVGRQVGMEKGKVKVVNEVGLHARPAALFVAKAASFKSDIRIHNATKDGKWVKP